MKLIDKEPQSPQVTREEMLQGLQRERSPDIDTTLSMDAIGTFGLALMVVAIVLFALNLIARRKKIKRQPLVFDKIVTDDSNGRAAIRVDFYRPLSVTGLRRSGKSSEFLGKAASLDLSMGGMSLLSTEELTKDMDMTFCFQESEIAASPSLTGVVLRSAIWKGGAEGGHPTLALANKDLGPKLYLVRLSFVNLSPETRLFLTRLITQREREDLTTLRETEEQAKDLKRTK